MSYAIPADEPGGAAPAALSLLVHGVLFALLVFSLHWQSKHPDPVVAELWTELPAFEPPAPKPEPKPEVKPQPKPEPKIEQKASKPDIALEREKKKKKEEPPLKFDNTQRIREQLAQEQQALSRSREKQEALKQFASPTPVGDPRYIEKIRARIWSKVTLPSDIKGNPEVVFEVIQLPTGDVLSAKLVKSSGHKLYDEAVERAIVNSSPLPRPDRPDQFMRELTLKFRPRD
jgi:colicin import membrane protein